MLFLWKGIQNGISLWSITIKLVNYWIDFCVSSIMVQTLIFGLNLGKKIINTQESSFDDLKIHAFSGICSDTQYFLWIGRDSECWQSSRPFFVSRNQWTKSASCLLYLQRAPCFWLTLIFFFSKTLFQFFPSTLITFWHEMHCEFHDFQKNWQLEIWICTRAHTDAPCCTYFKCCCLKNYSLIMTMRVFHIYGHRKL